MNAIENIITNVHVHCFTLNQVPVSFFPGQRLFAGSVKTQRALAKFLKQLPIVGKRGGVERAAIFLRRGAKVSQEDILTELALFYPLKTRFGVHTMDFEYMGAGKSKKNCGFLSQIEELAALKQKQEWKDILQPFICVDPRRPNIVALAKEYIINRGFIGIKLYPSLGYYPTDSRLDDLWAWAEEAQVPIMTHCSRSGPVYGRASNKEGLSKRDYANRYIHPHNYLALFEKYPRLKICFAHFGGEKDCMDFYKEGRTEDNWFSLICNMLKTYPGAYADISYTSSNTDLMALFHIYAQGEKLRDKILFGSDFYMAQLERNERWFSINVRSCMGEETFWRLAQKNIDAYLGGMV